MKEKHNRNKELESELFYDFFKVHELRCELTAKVKLVIPIRKKHQTQKEVSETIGYSLTKIKQVENGTCKDIDAILNYISYFKPIKIKII